VEGERENDKGRLQVSERGKEGETGGKRGGTRRERREKDLWNSPPAAYHRPQ